MYIPLRPATENSAVARKAATFRSREPFVDCSGKQDIFFTILHQRFSQ
jgi:hypothetical protein